MANVVIGGAPAQAFGGEGTEWPECGDVRDWREKVLEMNLFAVDVDAFRFPVMFESSGDNVNARAAVIEARKIGACGSNGGYGEFFVLYLIMFSGVIFASFAKMRSPFKLVEEPKKRFPPQGFEGRFDAASPNTYDDVGVRVV